ncbi:MAG: (Fe-S)-binding protein [Desulfobacterales bacterium]|nr:(Fe-S)-binding protein [Deltaproteobacteria bacterium]NNL74838.1 (Fe-S)-binding protein [Desulfobacterales bacterium]
MISTKNVTLFVQCLVDGLYPEVGDAMVTIFNRLGISLNCPLDQTCCGQPAFNAGYRTAARVAAKRFIEIFEDAESIVCPSGSCVHMVKNHYGELFKDDPKWFERAIQVGQRTFELSQYIVDILGIEDLGAHYPGKVTYHDSCHLLRGLGICEQPRRLIRNIKNAELIEMKDSDRCCGFGGTFSIKYPVISTAMVDDKVHNIIASGADTVTGCDVSCLMNIQGRLSRLGSSVKTLHIAQLLAG